MLRKRRYTSISTESDLTRRSRRLHAVLPWLFVLGALLASAGYAASSDADKQLEFGVDMAKRGLWAEALFRFKRAEQSMPSSPTVLNNLAVASEAVGRFEEALEYYKRGAASGNRELRKNYSRFLEFYQGFKPDEPAASSEPEEAAESEAVSDPEP